MADGKVVIDSKVDDSGVTKGLKAIQSKLSGFNANLIKTAALGSAISIAPSLVPAIAAATAATLALSASMGAAGIGVAAFGAVAVGVLGQVFDATDQVAQMEEKIANASSAKERIAAQKELAEYYAQMSEAQRFALEELKSFKAFWKDFTKQFEEPIFNSFGLSLHIVQELLEGLAPTISNVADVIESLLESMDQDISNGGMAKFFDWLNTNAADALYNFARIFGNLFAGVFELIMAFAPLGASMEEGLIGLTERFKDWAQSLSASLAFQTFVDYVIRNGPTLLSILGNLVGIIVSLGVALSPVGEIALNVLDILTSFLNGDLLGAAESFKRAFGEDALNSIVSFVDSLKSGLESAGLTLSVVKEYIATSIDSMVERVKVFSAYFISGWQMIWTYLQPLVMEIATFLAEKMQQITQFWKENGDQIMLAVQNAFNFILQVIEFIMPAVMFIVNTVWESIKGIINGALDMIMGAIKIFTGIFTNDWSMLWEGVKQLLAGALEFLWNLFNLFMLGKLIGGIKAFITGGINFFKSFADDIVLAFKSWIDNVISMFNHFYSTGLGIWKSITGAITSTVKPFIATLKSLFDEALQGATTVFNNIKEAITHPIRTARDTVKGLVDEIIGFFKGMKLELPKIKMPKFTVKNWSANPVDWIKAAPSLNVEWLANGAVVPPNSPGLYGLGDNKLYDEAAIPLSPKVLGTIGQKIADTMSGFTGQQTNQPAIIQIVSPDRRELARWIVDEITEFQEFNLNRF